MLSEINERVRWYLITLLNLYAILGFIGNAGVQDTFQESPSTRFFHSTGSRRRSTWLLRS